MQHGTLQISLTAFQALLAHSLDAQTSKSGDKKDWKTSTQTCVLIRLLPTHDGLASEIVVEARNLPA